MDERILDRIVEAKPNSTREWAVKEDVVIGLSFSTPKRAITLGVDVASKQGFSNGQALMQKFPTKYSNLRRDI